MTNSKAPIALIVALALTVGACGGGADEPDNPGTEGTNGGSDTTAASTDSSAPEDGGTTADVTVGRLTIDGTTYEFGLTGPAVRCVPDQFGGFWATLRNEEMSATLGVELWPEGDLGRVNKVSANLNVDGVEMDLVANPDVEPNWPAVEAGTSLVQSFEINGNTARGTASFVNDEVAYDASLFPLEGIIGEFEVVCGSDS